MTSFVNPSYSRQHLGAARLEALSAATLRLAAPFRGAKGFVALLVAGALSALVVVADQIVSTWTDGHLMMAWITLWVFVFAALALFAEASQGWSTDILAAWQKRSRAAAERVADEHIWAVAQSDPRFMADIQAARLRAERDALAVGEPLPSWPFADLPAHHIIPRPWS